MGTATTLEREVKLRFGSVDEAREAVQATGATPLRCRRLQEDALLDDAAETLRQRRCVLRVRVESGKSLLTFKGPVQPSPMKLREEIETVIGDGETMLRCFEELGLRRLVPVPEISRRVRAERRHHRHRRDAGRRVRRDRGRRAGHPRGDARPGSRPRRTSSWIPIARCSWSIGGRRAFLRPTCCSTRQSSRPHSPVSSRPAPTGALVLTAGLGTRLRPLTAWRAKPALPVAGADAGRAHRRRPGVAGRPRSDPEPASICLTPSPAILGDGAAPRRPRPLLVGAAAARIGRRAAPRVQRLTDDRLVAGQRRHARRRGSGGDGRHPRGVGRPRDDGA